MRWRVAKKIVHEYSAYINGKRVRPFGTYRGNQLLRAGSRYIRWLARRADREPLQPNL